MQRSKLQFKSQNWEMLPVDYFFEKLPVPKQYEKREVFETGKVPVIDQSQNGIYGYHNNKPDFLASSENPLITFVNHTCHVRFITFNFSVIQNVFPLRAKEGVDPKFFYFSILNKITPEGYKGHWPKFRELILPKPPLKIQKQIVARIEELFEKIDKAKELRQKAQEETGVILPSAIEEFFSQAEKKKWERKTIGEVTTRIQYGLSVPIPKIVNMDKAIPILRMANVTTNGQMNYSDIRYIEVKENDCQKFILKRGDVLFNWRNSKEYVGKTAVFEREDEMIFASFLLRLNVKPEMIIPKFLSIALNWLWRNDFFVRACDQAVSQANFNASKLREVEILIPPLSEQKKIVAYLDSLQEKTEKLKQIQQTQLEELTELKQSILSKAFKRELVK